MHLRVIVTLLFVFSVCSSAVAGGYAFVEPDQFRTWLCEGKAIAIVDIQTAADFRKQHFPASIETNAYPVKSEADKARLDKVLPKLQATDTPVVVICPRGGGGAKGAYDYLRTKGISEKRLFILAGGMQGWPYSELTAPGEMDR